MTVQYMTSSAEEKWVSSEVKVKKWKAWLLATIPNRDDEGGVEIDSVNLISSCLQPKMIAIN